MSSTPIEFQSVDFANQTPAEVVNTLMRQASEANASDLFMLSESGFVRVAMRRLGAMENLIHFSEEQGRPILNYVRTMCGMDVGDNRHAADGRWAFRDEGEDGQEELNLNVRANCLPTKYGIDLALRLLNDEDQLLEIDQLGLLETELGWLRAMLQTPHGLILVTGPTESGKTTTLYACLQHLNDGTRKINTLEDPIEYTIKGISQSQVASKTGMDFAQLLRNVMRQSPDVIMVGEVRDEETAKIAVRAANSGHLVFATLHARFASQAIEAMMAHGVNPYFLASSLRGVIAQRLLRTLDPKTRIPYDIASAEAMFADVRHLLREGEGTHIYGPCEDHSKAYDARSGVFEVLWVDADIRRRIVDGASSVELAELAVEKGMIDFRRGALLRIAQGLTSVEEMARIVAID